MASKGLIEEGKKKTHHLLWNAMQNRILHHKINHSETRITASDLPQG